MKLIIKDPNLLAAFQKVEGKEGVVQAEVLGSSMHDTIRLAALGGAPIELGIEGLIKGHFLVTGQTVNFTADGTFDGEPAIQPPANKEKKERVHTGGSSPLAAPEKSHRFA